MEGGRSRKSVVVVEPLISYPCSQPKTAFLGPLGKGLLKTFYSVAFVLVDHRLNSFSAEMTAVWYQCLHGSEMADMLYWEW